MTVKKVKALARAPKVWNWLTVHKRKQMIRHISDVSQTVPDQTLSLRTLMERYSNGQPINGVDLKPLYEDEEQPSEGINIKTLDLADMEEMLHNVRSTTQDHYKGKTIALAEAQRDKEIKLQTDLELEIEARILEKQKKSDTSD